VVQALLSWRHTGCQLSHEILEKQQAANGQLDTKVEVESSTRYDSHDGHFISWIQNEGREKEGGEVNGEEEGVRVKVMIAIGFEQ